MLPQGTLILLGDSVSTAAIETLTPGQMVWASNAMGVQSPQAVQAVRAQGQLPIYCTSYEGIMLNATLDQIVLASFLLPLRMDTATSIVGNGRVYQRADQGLIGPQAAYALSLGQGYVTLATGLIIATD